jgi:ABC-type dipeptide/oligopeptide/nickel transport system permease component
MESRCDPLTRFIIRRLLLTIPVLLGASLLIYAMVYALPGDPVRALAEDRVART